VPPVLRRLAVLPEPLRKSTVSPPPMIEACAALR